MGRLTADPVIKTGTRPDGSTFKTATFNLAVDGYKDHTDFIRVVAFDKKADVIEKYFKKGSRILVKGRINTGSYTKQDGTKVYTTDVYLEELDFCESKQSEQPQQADGFTEIPDDFLNDPSLPF